MGLAQIAELLGVSVQRISQIATGKHGTARPRPSLAARIAEFFKGEPEAGL